MSYEQLFRKQFDTSILQELLEKITYKTNGTYLVDENVYKKMLFHGLEVEFYNQLREYYHKSKHFYLDRELNYKTFTTVLRQLCKYNQIPFDSRIKYMKSVYKNEYVISL